MAFRIMVKVIFLLFSCRSSGFASDFLLVIYLARFLINDFSVLTYGVAGKTATTTMLLLRSISECTSFTGFYDVFTLTNYHLCKPPELRTSTWL